MLAWQSVYNIYPANDQTGTSDHTLLVQGSRTGTSLINFDDQPIIGYETTFAQSVPQVTWSTKTGAPINAILQFNHVAEFPTDQDKPEDGKALDDGKEEQDTSIGRRVVYAWLYKDGDPVPVPSPPYPAKPTNYTHVGHDFFDDISKFNGSYTTK